MCSQTFDESDYIFDDYEHLDSRVFYSVTKVPGKGCPFTELDCFEEGCNCLDLQCTSNCSCLKYGNNYKSSNDGLVLEIEKFKNIPIYECNFQCSCFKYMKNSKENPKKEMQKFCQNRNVQYGPIDGLEIFSAGEKGLGLKTKKKLSSGTFICEYAGEVIGVEEAKLRLAKTKEMNFIFVLKEFAGNQLRSVTCVDPTYIGNIGRYINHSCQPNSAVVPIRVNTALPWLCIFAIRDIEADEEISYDYSGNCFMDYSNDILNSKKQCFCGSANCRKFLPFDDKV